MSASPLAPAEVIPRSVLLCAFEGVPYLLAGLGDGQLFTFIVDEATGELGRAVQIDPTKPMLKALKTKRLKLNYDEPLLSFAFKFNLRRYSWATASS
jgi:hypothetical protein